MSNFYTDVIKQDSRYHTTGLVASLNMLELVTRQAVMNLIADALEQGIHLMIFETFRSQERQKVLFDKGVTKLEHVGVHNFGLAADIVRSVNEEPSWKGDFSFMATLARKQNLISGLDWGHPEAAHSFVDAVHVQRCSLSRQQALFAGTWYPGSTYNPYAD